MAERTQRSNILLAFISLTAVIAVVSLIGFFTLGKGPEIIQGQAEADEYRVSGKVPARILELRVKEGDKVKSRRYPGYPRSSRCDGKAVAGTSCRTSSPGNQREGTARDSPGTVASCFRNVAESQSRSRNC